MKYRELIKLVERPGWGELPRTGTSHSKFRHPDFRDPLIIAGDPGDDVSRGMLHKLMRQAGLSVIPPGRSA